MAHWFIYIIFRTEKLCSALRASCPSAAHFEFIIIYHHFGVACLFALRRFRVACGIVASVSRGKCFFFSLCFCFVGTSSDRNSKRKRRTWQNTDMYFGIPYTMRPLRVRMIFVTAVTVLFETNEIAWSDNTPCELLRKNWNKLIFFSLVRVQDGIFGNLNKLNSLSGYGRFHSIGLIHILAARRARKWVFVINHSRWRFSGIQFD